MNREDDIEALTEALRLDLPSAGDEKRVRARLAAAGVLAGAATVAAPSAAVVAAAPRAGLFAKLGALPATFKLGVSVAVVGAAAVPFLHDGAQAPEAAASGAPASVLVTHAASRGTTPGAAPVARAHEPAGVTGAPSRPVALGGSAAPSLPVESVAASARAGAAAAIQQPRPNLAARGDVRPPVGGEPVGSEPVGSEPSPARPSVGAFPVVSAKPLDEGTLREETALMERALGALRQGDLPAARRALDEHAARFPNGHLAPEREGARRRLADKETRR